MNKPADSSAKRFLKKHVLKGTRTALRNLTEEWRRSRQHRSALKQVGRFLQRPEKKLHLGCGPNLKAGWINIDLFDSRADLRLDLREEWPFADATIGHVYSEHVFEHFEIREEVPHLLSESCRVLRPGGLFDVGVPETVWPLRAFGNSDDQYWAYAKAWHPEWCETQLDHINYHFRQGTEHKYAWDYETLAITLRRSGFTSIERREFDPALDRSFHLDGVESRGGARF